MTHMNSDQAFSAIEKIAALPGKNDKQAMVKQFLAFETFKRALIGALDPLTTYGLRQIPERIDGAAPGGNTFENAPIWETLDRLAKRELTGNAARDEVQRLLTFLTEPSAELFRRIIRKDLRAGFSASTVNKAWPKLIQTFPYMRCSLVADAKFETWSWAAGVFSQEKADGMFLNLNKRAGQVSFVTRQGNPIPLDHLGDIVDEAEVTLADDTQTHGEMLVLIDGIVAPRAIGNGIMNHIADGGAFEPNQRPMFLAWDQIPIASVVPKGKCEATYRQRFTGLIKQFAAAGPNMESVRPIPTRVVHSFAEAMVHYRELLLAKKEGSILGNGDGTWKDGTSKDKIKLKLEVPVDLIVTGIVAGNVATKNEGRAGSLTMQTSDGRLVVDVTVKNEKLRDLIDAKPDDYIGRIWSVIFNDITKPSQSNDLHSLFLPRMAEDSFRIDKDEADSLPEVFKQYDNAITGA
jgi:DNA ligase 1